MRVDEFPEHPTHKELKDIESQMREALTIPSVYDSTVERGVADEVCKLLVQTNLSETDLRRLYELAEPPY